MLRTRAALVLAGVALLAAPAGALADDPPPPPTTTTTTTPSLSIDWSAAADKVRPESEHALTIILPIVGGILALFTAYLVLRKMLDDDWDRAEQELESGESIGAYEKGLIESHNEGDGW